MKQISQNNITVTVDDIDAALSCGRVFGSKGFRLAIDFIIGLLGLGLLACSGYLIYVAVNGIFVAADVIPVCFFAVMLGISFGFFARVYSDKRKIALWLRDAVVLYAETETWGKRVTRAPHEISSLKVTFGYEKKRYVRYSVGKKNGDTVYAGIFGVYADKRITIAYSQRYDEVMIVKIAE